MVTTSRMGEVIGKVGLRLAEGLDTRLAELREERDAGDSSELGGGARGQHPERIGRAGGWRNSGARTRAVELGPLRARWYG